MSDDERNGASNIVPAPPSLCEGDNTPTTIMRQPMFPLPNRQWLQDPHDRNSRDFLKDRDHFASLGGRRNLFTRWHPESDVVPRWYAGTMPKEIFPPQLVVLVVKLTDALHLVSPVWRGRPYCEHQSELTDLEVASRVKSYADCGGFNHADWEDYIARRDAALGITQ